MTWRKPIARECKSGRRSEEEKEKNINHPHLSVLYDVFETCFDGHGCKGFRYEKKNGGEAMLKVYAGRFS